MILSLRLSFLFKIIFSAITILTTVNCIAQSTFIFTPAGDDEAKLKSLTADLEKRYSSATANVTSEYKKDLLEIYKSQWDNVKTKFDKKEIYTAPEAQQYLDKLVAEIKNSNPVLQSIPINCFFIRTAIPNASYIGEGVIVFNMGLFNKLANESQAAFVLCHELSHLYLHHSENSFNRYVALLNSDNFQKELKKIKNSEYGKREELEKLLKGLSFNSSRHSRDHESEADSMALKFLSNTRFNIGESLTALALLDSIDADNFNTEACLQKLFDAKEYPFQKKWLVKESGLLGGHAELETDKAIADSLKTHPDCMQRVKMLEPMVKQYGNRSAAKNVISESTFQQLQKTFSYEIIEYYFTSEQYTKSLFYTLQLIQKNPSDPYLITQIGKIFNSFYTAQKSHTLGKVIDLPSPYCSPNYNQLLQFVQNLYQDDFAQIGFNFLKPYSPALETYTPFKNTYNSSLKSLKQ